MTRTLDGVDAKLLNLLQEEIPLVEHPFAALGERLGTDEADVIRRVTSLRAKPTGVIRQISAIFDSGSLGYRSCLVAARVDEARLEAAVREINAHPGVSHNYLRNHAYNVWYTVAVPPTSGLGLERTVEELHRRSGAIATRMLPTLKLFKIGVKFDVTGEREATQRVEPAASHVKREAGRGKVEPADQKAIRVLQQDLSAESRPFDAWAAEAGMSVGELLELTKTYKQVGWMRRFAAVLRHREAGFGANAMGVWVVPPEKQEAFGATAASFASVSHCYLRPTYEDWPYSIFTMVHGQTPADCQAVLAEISSTTGIKDYGALYSSKEFKKVRVKYFTGDVEEWERNTVDGRVDSKS